VLAEFLKSAQPGDSIGGAPQLIRVTQHMNTRPLCVRWGDEDTLFGRPLFGYENTDYWIVEPFTGRILMPRKYGHREHYEIEGECEPEGSDSSGAPAGVETADPH
jgi:hypothetical protein